jgi:membrane-associated protein
LDFITYLVDLLLHLSSKNLGDFFNQYSIGAYVFIFIIIFIETGLVVTPFLPGDSLLFVTGAIAASGEVNIASILVLLYIAAILGDTVNYEIGHSLREKVQKREKIPLVKMENIEKAQDFLKRNGGKTITIARFIPIIRTFAPFVAGAGKMPYHSFIVYNIIGGLSWVTLLFGIGYFFGNIPYVENHFSLVVIGIIVISVMPAVVVYIHNKIKKKKANVK